MGVSLYSLHIAKVFSPVLVRKCGNFQIPRTTKIRTARVQIMLKALFNWADTPYLTECGVSSSLSGIGSYHNLLTDERKWLHTFFIL